MGRMAGNPWQDAKRKMEYLQARYASVSPCRFYDEILGHIEDEPDFQLCAMHAQAKKGQRMRRYDDVWTCCWMQVLAGMPTSTRRPTTTRMRWRF